MTDSPLNAPFYIGQHVVLRHIWPTDAKLYHDWLQNSEFIAYKPYLKQLCPAPSQLAAYITLQIHASPRTEYEVLVIHKSTQTPIGIIALSGIDEFNKKAEFSAGFIRGHGTRSLLEAIHAAIFFSFEQFQLHKIICYVAENNKRVLKLLPHYGFGFEGCFKEEVIGENNQRIDLHRFSLMRSDWEHLPIRQRLKRLAPIKQD